MEISDILADRVSVEHFNVFGRLGCALLTTKKKKVSCTKRSQFCLFGYYKDNSGRLWIASRDSFLFKGEGCRKCYQRVRKGCRNRPR